VVVTVEVAVVCEAPEDERAVVSEDVLTVELVEAGVVEMLVVVRVVVLVLDFVVEDVEDDVRLVEAVEVVVVLEEEAAVVVEDVDDVGGPVWMTWMLPEATFAT
jgi:hypothetical protein